MERFSSAWPLTHRDDRPPRHDASPDAAMAGRCGGVVRRVDPEDGTEATVELLRLEIETFRPEVITITHGETSSTTLNGALADITKLAREFGCYVIVDAVCTISTMPFEMDA